MDYVYVGLFFDEYETGRLYSFVEQQRGNRKTAALSARKNNIHITFAHKNEIREVHKELFGKRIKVAITGYANNGKNEGVSVEFVKDQSFVDIQDRVYEIIKEGKKLHITTSLSNSAAAKNTEKLEFAGIEKDDQIVIEGVYGGYISGDAVITDSYSRSETPSNCFFISPFACEPREKVVLNKKIWRKEEVKLRYPTRFVQEVFSDHSGICEHWVADYQYFDLYGKKLQRVRIDNSGSHHDDRDEVSFFVRKIEIYSFTTGMSFLVTRIEYGKDESFDSMVDLSANLSNLLAKGGKSNRWRFIDSESKKDVDILSSVMSLVYKSITEKKQMISWFDNSTNQKCNVFNQIILDQKKKGDTERLCKMARGLGVTSTVDVNSMNCYSPGSGRKWAIDTNGVASFTWYNGKKRVEKEAGFLRGNYQDNLIRYYLPVYLLALHEREAFIDFNYRAVKDWKKPRKLQKLRRKILLFSTWSASNTISTESNYQRFYQELHTELCLESLEQDVAQVVEQVDEYEERKADRRMNVLLFGIAILTLFSVLVDGTDFLEKCIGQTSENVYMGDLGHWIFYGAILLIIIVFAWIALKREKK